MSLGTLFLGFGRGGSFRRLRILPRKALDAPRSIQQLRLAGEKRVARGTNFHAHQVPLVGRTRLESAATGAVDRNFVVVGMNSRFHAGSKPPAGLRGPRQRTTAASLGQRTINDNTRTRHFFQLPPEVVAVSFGSNDTTTPEAEVF
jgi:hypothetical protein